MPPNRTAMIPSRVLATERPVRTASYMPECDCPLWVGITRMALLYVV